MVACGAYDAHRVAAIISNISILALRVDHYSEGSAPYRNSGAIHRDGEGVGHAQQQGHGLRVGDVLEVEAHIPIQHGVIDDGSDAIRGCHAA